MNLPVSINQFWGIIYNSPSFRLLWDETLSNEQVVAILNNVPDEEFEKSIRIPFLVILHEKKDLLKISQELPEVYSLKLSKDQVEVIFEYIANYLSGKYITLLLEESNVQGITTEALNYQLNKEKLRFDIDEINNKLREIAIPFDELRINLLKAKKVALESELTRLENENEILSRIETRGQNTLAMFTKEGRPNCEHLDWLIYSLFSFGNHYYPKNYWSKIIQPTLLYMAREFPDLLDSNDFRIIDNVKSRMKHIKSKINKSRGENSTTKK